MTESGYYGADVNAAVEMYTGEVARLNAEVARLEAENESLRGDDGQRDDETLVRWLRTANQRLGARHWRRFRQR